MLIDSNEYIFYNNKKIFFGNRNQFKYIHPVISHIANIDLKLHDDHDDHDDHGDHDDHVF